MTVQNNLSNLFGPMNARIGKCRLTKKLWFMALSFCIAAGALGQSGDKSWHVTIRGKVNNPQDGQILLLGSGGGRDTLTLNSDKTFEKRVKLSEPGNYILSFYDKQRLPLMLYKNDVEITVDGNTPKGMLEIKGSPEHDLSKQIQEMMQAAQNSPEFQKLLQEYREARQQKDEKLMEEIRMRGEQILEKDHAKVSAFVQQNSPSLAVINFLQRNPGFDVDKYLDAYVAVAEKLKKEWPSYTVTKEFVEHVEKMKALVIGQPAPEISMPDPEGKMVALSSLKGKYVLVDFWAKWCGPCRKENPNVVKAYNDYKDKGFTVFGVSLDRNKEDWVKAIEEDGLTWTHVSDLKYWKSEAAQKYNVNSIPFSLLLDPNGIIIGKNLRGEKLHTKLAEIFDKKP